MRYVIASGLCVLCAIVTALVTPLRSCGGIVSTLFILASAILMFVGTLRLNRSLRR